MSFLSRGAVAVISRCASGRCFQVMYILDRQCGHVPACLSLFILFLDKRERPRQWHNKGASSTRACTSKLPVLLPSPGRVPLSLFILACILAVWSNWTWVGATPTYCYCLVLCLSHLSVISCCRMQAAY
jgi:hypothetical protein